MLEYFHKLNSSFAEIETQDLPVLQMLFLDALASLDLLIADSLTDSEIGN